MNIFEKGSCMVIRTFSQITRVILHNFLFFASVSRKKMYNTRNKMKIEKKYNKQKKCYFWHARFKLNSKHFTPIAETKEKLLDLIAEIRSQEKIDKENKKYNLNREVPSYIPTVSELLDEVLPTVPKHHQRTLAKRV